MCCGQTHRKIVLQERCDAAEAAAAALQEERDLLLADADAKNARQMAMQDRISKLEVRRVLGRKEPGTLQTCCTSRSTGLPRRCHRRSLASLRWRSSGSCTKSGCLRAHSKDQLQWVTPRFGV